MHTTIFTIDLGPEFTGWSGVVDGRIVCIVPPTLANAGELQLTARALLRKQGAPVAACPCQTAIGGGTVEAAA